MKTILIAAMTKTGRTIGKDGKLPWHLPEDLVNFKNVTMGKPVVMGRKTYESLPQKFRPLPGRRNVVISGSGTNVSWAETVRSPEEALRLLGASGEAVVFVIGGGQVYSAFLEKALADEVWLSLIDEEYEWDARFPEFETDFEAYESVRFESFKFVRYKKRS